MGDQSLKNKPTMQTAPSVTLEKAALWLFGGAFVLFLFCYAIRPITDPDFWWHLKSGEFMVQSGKLLQFDPFTFTGDGVVSIRESLILKGYWLWQVTAYGLYSVFGFNGIFLLNFLTVLAMAGVVIQQMRQQRVNYALAIFLMTLGFFLLRATYLLERPQIVSFLGTAILLALLARVRDGGLLRWTLPLLMLVWANLHGGFVVGDIILLCFAAGVVVEYRHDLPRLRHLLLWVVVGICASFLNPNGVMVFGELFSFHNSALMTGISEYQSTWVKYQQGFHSVVVLWVLIALYGAGLWISRRIFYPEILIAVFLAYFSASYMRNVGFFAVGMLPMIGCHMQEAGSRRHWRLPAFVSLLLISLCASILLWLSFILWQEREGAGPVKAIYPEDAITFVHDSGLQGRMFNSYEYGGYLLWRLAPQIKIFIDGRGTEDKVFGDWQKISMASTAWVDGRREYEALLDNYAIDYIIQPIYDGDGQILPLMKILLNKPEWIPIYLDATVYLLARINPTNAETIGTYRIDKSEFKTRLLLIYNYLSQSYPEEVGYQVARAEMLIYLSMYDEAMVQVEKIAAITPHERTLPNLRQQLAILRAKRLRQ